MCKMCMEYAEQQREKMENYDGKFSEIRGHLKEMKKFLSDDDDYREICILINIIIRKIDKTIDDRTHNDLNYTILNEVITGINELLSSLSEEDILFMDSCKRFDILMLLKILMKFCLTSKYL